jgi:hypothetical protein
LAQAGRQANPRDADAWIRRAAAVVHATSVAEGTVDRRAALARHADAAVATAVIWFHDPSREPAATLEAFLLADPFDSAHAAARLDLPLAAIKAYREL